MYLQNKNKEQSGSARLDCLWVFCIFVEVPIDSGPNRRRHHSAFVVIHVVARYIGVIGLDLPLDCICCCWVLYAPLLGCIRRRCWVHHHWIVFAFVGLRLPSLGFEFAIVGFWIPVFAVVGTHWHPWVPHFPC